jgi:hypothetical protein
MFILMVTGQLVPHACSYVQGDMTSVIDISCIGKMCIITWYLVLVLMIIVIRCLC